jgi:hypothetical protein
VLAAWRAAVQRELADARLQALERRLRFAFAAWRSNAAASQLAVARLLAHAAMVRRRCAAEAALAAWHRLAVAARERRAALRRAASLCSARGASLQRATLHAWAAAACAASLSRGRFWGGCVSLSSWQHLQQVALQAWASYVARQREARRHLLSAAFKGWRFAALVAAAG